jgi:uncharacterized protein HemX
VHASHQISQALAAAHPVSAAETGVLRGVGIILALAVAGKLVSVVQARKNRREIRRRFAAAKARTAAAQQQEAAE